MQQASRRQKQAKLLRIFRKVHRSSGACLFVFFICVAITGLLLGWKKHSNGLIQPHAVKGTTQNMSTWLPIDSLYTLANLAFTQSAQHSGTSKIDRIDVKPDKGYINFIYKPNYVGVQLDGATGKVLLIAKRPSDLIEKIHDGSILDIYFGTSSEQIKLVYTSIMGLALLMFSVTGFWLWYGPKRMRKH